MSTKDDRLDLMRRLLSSQAAKAKSVDDLGNKLLDDAEFLFIEEVARMDQQVDRSQGTDEPLWRRFLMTVPRAVAGMVYVKNYGTVPLKNRLIEEFQAGLERQTTIKPAHRRILNVYRMVEFSEGDSSITGAPAEAYAQAKMWMAVIGVLTLAILWVAWTTLSQFPAIGIPVAYTMGYLIGWCWRDSYDHAWGRDRLAQRLAQRLPFMRLRSLVG